MSAPESAAEGRRSSEAELIDRCRDADDEAWDTLFDKYYGIVARFVFQLSADFSHEDTEEICQETFLSIVRNLESFRGKSSFQTWLLRIAVNVSLNWKRNRRPTEPWGEEESVASPAASPEEIVLLRLQVQGALNRYWESKGAPPP